jgi:hypothetical protein
MDIPIFEWCGTHDDDYEWIKFTSDLRLHVAGPMDIRQDAG